MTTAVIDGAIDFDAAALGRFLFETLGADQGLFRLTRIGGGQSNPSYFLDYGDRCLVLRKQPAGPILRGAHAIDREYRVLEALYPTDVPVPRPVLFHADAELLGTSFYLMERVEGRVLTDTSLQDVDPADRRSIWMAVADAMAAMHRIRPDEVGLGDYGKPGSYFERQIGRWNRQYRDSPSGPIDPIERLYDWLVANQPADDGLASLCHGDFRLGNLMFHPSEQRVVAILDWELSTLGHPLADLAFCCMPWHTSPEEYGGLLGHDLDARQLPKEDDVVARYMAANPSAPPLRPFHKAFALYRFAVIFVGIADRAKAGSAVDPDAEKLGPLAEQFAIRALEIAESRPHRLSRS
ncbi:MAG: phosphotransferase family protein [Pseudomonadota bacterium]